ncbi:hypothetical protein K469DRAFT_643182 [Zopfia rhizophila CBS 207.26]|uniref:Zn(2)-C6 fungal-type domain-containing protein n=1 Tax=Zopfia rhizophila CBS 207.26 TaxID=1314779 RepID=A0A6A6DKQ1_9PEZI|nr:hypothetical protein K469DRAFT_643182 [Zopfia rhizophila CBS 207.26]
MPGVPSGRGCDACRKQKKKCDQSKPSCSRCTRLQIPCIGCGEQRYKFKDQKMVFRSAGFQAAQGVVSVSTVPALPRIPSNQTTMVASAFVSQLEVTDIRYDLTCYGAFLRHIPRRLGTNAALDASVGAVTSAFSSLHTGQHSLDALTKYIHALKTLRVCLNDPVRARTVDTLCAIYLIMICQSWIGKHDDQSTNHGEGIAYILKVATFQKWQGSLEVEMLITLSVPVIVESITNPKIQLNSWFWKFLEAYRPPKPPRREDPGITRDEGSDAVHIPSLRLRNLAKIPDFVQDPGRHLLDMRNAYQELRADSQKVRQLVDESRPISGISTLPLATPQMRLHRDYQTAYGILLSLIMILCGLLRAYDPYDTAFAEDSISFGDEIIALAKEASKYRPLGAGYIPLCLATAWATIGDTTRRAIVEMLLSEYQKDFAELRWMNMAMWWRTKFDTLRLNLSTCHEDMQENHYKAFNATGSEEGMTGRGSNMCCVQ